MIAKAITIGEIFKRDKAEQERARQRDDAIMNWKLTVGPIYQKGLREGIEKGIEQGLEKGRREMARSFLINGTSPEFVAKSSGLPLDEVMALIDHEVS
ncbi:hypothetical protein FACS1894187_04540 [Synergistales bacterium]|nr:hypothetical protein FACS1894187_04540 [Synergistales bacterium]